MKYFHVTQKEIDAKLFNIFIGVSLGNKALTLETAKRYVKWAHDNTKEDAIVLIADDIDVINWMVFAGLNKESAMKKARNKGYGIKGIFDKAIRELAREGSDPSFIAKIHIVFWSDIKNTGYDHLRKILFTQYKSNELFRKKILYFVGKYIELRGARVSNQDKDLLAEYIIDELPTLLGGVYWNDKLYNLILYPTYVDSGMSKFVLDIRGGKYFNSSHLLLRQLCVMVEDHIPEPKLTKRPV